MPDHRIEFLDVKAHRAIAGDLHDALGSLPQNRYFRIAASANFSKAPSNALNPTRQIARDTERHWSASTACLRAAARVWQRPNGYY